MIHFTKGSSWKWNSPELILNTLPYFIYRVFRTYVQHKVRDFQSGYLHPAPGRGKESRSRQPQDRLGGVPWQVWQLPWTSPPWALSRPSPASLGRVTGACPHTRRKVLGFSTAISRESKAEAHISYFPGPGPLCLCYWLTLTGILWL